MAELADSQESFESAMNDGDRNEGVFPLKRSNLKKGAALEVSLEEDSKSRDSNDYQSGK